MMNRKDFFEYVKHNVTDYLPEKFADAQVQLQEVTKKNGLTLTGVVIPVEETNITPTIYLDSFYQEYCNGKNLDSCVGDVADIWIENMDTDLSVDVNRIMDYGNIKNKLQHLLKLTTIIHSLTILLLRIFLLHLCSPIHINFRAFPCCASFFRHLNPHLAQSQ